MSSSDTFSKRLDIATRSVDLTTTLVKSPAVDVVGLIAHASHQGATELIEWLARERLSKDAFITTMKLGQNFAAPNLRGEDMLERLNITASRLYGLRLVIPGALGRKIFQDETLRWVGTTEAILLRYHDTDHVVKGLVQLFVGRMLPRSDPKHMVVAARTVPVIRKLVESIHLHTTNMGEGVSPLPAVLEALSKHFLSEWIFADALATIQELSDLDVLILMEYPIIDLLDWIYHHWTGRLLVSVANSVILDEHLGHDPQALHCLRILIQTDCIRNTDCNHRSHAGHFEIGRSSDDTFNATTPLYRGETDPRIPGNEGLYRSNLYSFRNSFAELDCSLSIKEENAARRNAQEICRSILALHVQPGTYPLTLDIDKSSTRKFQWWLKKTPTFLQSNLSENTMTRPLYTGVLQQEDEDMEKDFNTADYGSDQLVEWYPEIGSVMKLARERCECGCKRENFEETIKNPLDSGCLMALMFAEIMLVLGHAMAEAAGASDISHLRGVQSSTHLIEAVGALLGQIASEGQIRWNIWFKLAACAITGLPCNEKEVMDYDGTTFSEYLCCVAGSMTVAPLWFDFDSEIQLESSWGVRVLSGRVNGVEAEHALIQGQATMYGRDKRAPTQATVKEGVDSADVDVKCGIFPADGLTYRLMMIITTNNAMCALNPTDVYHAAMLAVRPTCSHEIATAMTIYPWSLDTIIQCWTRHGDLAGEWPHVALIGDSVLKQNIVLGFARSRCVMQNRQCCFSCLVKEAKERNLVGIWCGSQNGRPQKKIRFR
jgi:hypothetical protein